MKWSRGSWIVGVVFWALAGFVCAAQSKPLKVFILAGQSNMQGHAHVRTIDAMALDPEMAPLLKEMRNEDGSPRVCENVWISSIGSSESVKSGQLTVGYGAEAGGPKIGPEFTFGIYMEKLLDEPILIIKTAWGGKSLNTDFRPPSAGPYGFKEEQLEQFQKQGKDVAQMKAQRAEATGHYYRLMLEHVRSVLADPKSVYPGYDVNQRLELAGFVWFQGWNDMVDRGTYPNRDKEGGYGEYSELLAQFIRDVRKDLAAPELPFVIGVMGVNGPTELYGPDQQRYQSTHENFRIAMRAPAALPEFQGSVVAVETAPFWDMEVSALRKRERDEVNPLVDELKSKVKAKEMTPAAASVAQEQIYADHFTPRELTILKDSVSNQEYHYLGSAKIMAQIGRGFAEAMAPMVSH